jgi:hypothetical protein
MNWRIETECFLNFADALTAGMIQIEGLHGGATHSGYSFDLIAIKTEVFWPELQEGMK